MDSSDLAYFAAVAAAGGIGRAALGLNTVQSNVTQHIHALEAKVGAPLFHRSKRGVTLTVVGERLLPYATRVADLLVEARKVACDPQIPGGALRIGAMETTAAVRLPSILSRYAGRYPAVDLMVETGTTESLVGRVLARELDGAFVAGPLTHADLSLSAMFDEELVVCTAPGVTVPEGLQGGQPKIITFRAGCSYRQRTEDFVARHGLVGLRRLEMGTLDGMTGCVAAGVGFTLLPRAVVASAAAAGRLSLHKLPGDTGRSTTQFIRRSDAFVTAALKAFVGVALEPIASGREDIGSNGLERHPF